jgi:cell division protein YceG involved in septum cleavage
MCVSGVVLLLFTACVATDSRQDEAIRDFISVEALQEENQIRTSTRDKREILNEDFIIYEARTQNYLIEFQSGCYDLVNENVVADVRFDANQIRARFDTINGCGIGHIYPLDERQSAELIELAEATK